VFLTVGWSGSVTLNVTATWIGLAVALTFRTSRVPHRLMLAVRVAVILMVTAAIGAALGGGERASGAIVILTSLLVLARSRRRPFSGTSFFAQPGQHGPADFAYFSYITMATVGYGDLSPATGLPRPTRCSRH
jgi:prepilin signal peptidase PulO-like enzyme (type II secretory pathway)